MEEPLTPPADATPETKEQYHTASGIMDKINSSLDKVMDEMPVEALVRFRDLIQQGHAIQLAKVNDKLRQKGYVEPHLADALKHPRE